MYKFFYGIIVSEVLSYIFGQSMAEKIVLVAIVPALLMRFFYLRHLRRKKMDLRRIVIGEVIKLVFQDKENTMFQMCTAFKEIFLVCSPGKFWSEIKIGEKVVVTYLASAADKLSRSISKDQVLDVVDEAKFFLPDGLVVAEGTQRNPSVGI